MSADWLKQNSPDALTAIAASDTLWCQVQQLRTFQLIVIVGLPVLLALAAQMYTVLALGAAYFGLLMLLLDVGFVNWWITERRREAARAQDRFDSISFSLKRSESRTTNDTDIARLLELARAQPPARRARNLDWYTPSFQRLPKELGQLACMRESATWDSTLRLRWSSAVIQVMIIVIACFVTLDVFTHQPMDVFLQSIAVPLSPAIAWAIREFREQRDSARAVAAIQENIRHFWDQAISDRLSEQELTSAVSEISIDFLQYRSNTSPVPHAVYKFFRDRQTTSASETACLLLREYEREANMND